MFSHHSGVKSINKNPSQPQPRADIAILSCLKLGLPGIRVEFIDLQRYNAQIMLVADSTLHYLYSVCSVVLCIDMFVPYELSWSLPWSLSLSVPES